MLIPSSKEGNGKEIRSLHDMLLQHYRALKAMDEDKFETLLAGIIELKVDPTTMKDWQHFTREKKEVPLSEDLLDFLDLQACDTEKSVRHVVKKRPTASNPGERTTKSYTASVKILVLHARMTIILYMGTGRSLHYCPTRECSLSGTVVYASIV